MADDADGDGFANFDRRRRRRRRGVRAQPDGGCSEERCTEIGPSGDVILTGTLRYEDGHNVLQRNRN